MPTPEDTQKNLAEGTAKGLIKGLLDIGVFKALNEIIESRVYLWQHEMIELAKDKRYEAQAKRESSYSRDFLEKTHQYINEIPNSELIDESNASLAKPVIDAALGSYNSEEYLRDMFAKLLASSIDKRYADKVHHSFVEIIKQLAPNDASNLLLINDSQKMIVNILFKSKRDFNIIFENLFIENPKYDTDSQAVSLTNLKRLGLIDISYSMWSSPKENYDVFKTTPEFMALENLIKNQDKMANWDFQKEIDLQPGLVKITPLGKSFVASALRQN